MLTKRVMRDRRSDGAAMLLVLIALALCTILALSFLAAQQPTALVASNIDRKTQARAIAESALKMAIDYVNEDADWRTDKNSGQWMSDVGLDGGTFTLTGIDEADGDLADDSSQAVLLTVVASYQGVTHRVSARVTPGTQAGSANRLLLVAGNRSSLSMNDSHKRDLFESWGYIVTVIDDSASQLDYDAAVAVNDVVFVSEQVDSVSVNTKLRGATIGVINDESGLYDDFGFSSTSSTSQASSNSIDIVDNTHSITSGFSVGPLTFYDSPIDISYISGTMPIGATVLADRSGSEGDATFIVADIGDALHNGAAAGRRVVFPSVSGMNVNSLTTDGQLLLRRCIEWAAGETTNNGASPTLLALYTFEEQAVADPSLIGHWRLDESATATGLGGVDSTYGYDTVGNNSRRLDRDAAAMRFTLTEPMTINSLTAYVNGGDDEGKLRMAIYDDGASAPGSLLAQTSKLNAPEEAWRWITGSLTPLSLSPGSYWLALSLDSEDNDARYRYQSGGSNNIHHHSMNAVSGGFNSTWGSSSSTYAGQLCIYASSTGDGAVDDRMPPAVDEAPLGSEGAYVGDAKGLAVGFGDGGTAVQFDGDGDYLEIPHDSAYLLDRGSVGLHFYADSLGGEQALFSKDANDIDTGGHLHVYAEGNQLKARIQTTSDDPYRTGASVELESSRSALNDSAWHHALVTWGDGQFRLYLDGALVDAADHLGGLGPASGGSGNDEPIVIGAGTTNSADQSATPINAEFTGRIDDVRIYDMPLDLGQAANLAGGSEPGPRTVPGYVIADTACYGTAMDLVIYDTTAISWVAGGGLKFTGQTVATSQAYAAKLHDAIEANEAFAIEVTLQQAMPASTASPSRIVSLTDGPSDHSFLIGQDASHYEVRVRDSATSSNGTLSPEFVSNTDLSSSGETHLILSYQAGEVSVYIDGVLDESATAGGTLNNWDADHFLVLAGAYTGTSHWLGTLKRIAIYDSAFNAIQAQNVFKGKAPGTGESGVSGTGRVQWDEQD